MDERCYGEDLRKEDGMKILVGIIITTLGGTAAALGVALKRSCAKRKEAEYILNTWGGKTFSDECQL